MTTEENKAVARRFVEVLQEFFRTGDANLMDSVLADNVVQHISGLPPEAKSLEGFKQLLPALPQAFPDVLFEVENLVAEGDMVAFRLNWSGTHQGEFFWDSSDRHSGDGDGDAHVSHRRWKGRGALG